MLAVRRQLLSNPTLPWWQQAVGYQIYPRSFYDTNHDGIGDLKGIRQKLNYLHDLGINLIWICPFFKSPMDDYGYDVQDYLQVDPSYGTLEDFKVLLADAHRLGIRIIIDLVLNHTSDEHRWFMEARKNRYSKYHQYYIWKDPRITPEGQRLPPTNWRGYFGDSAWHYDDTVKQFYLKIFSKKMPDLNWENPALRKDMFAVAKFWLDLGVDGFRLDAIAHLGKDLTFTNSTMPVDQDGMVLDSNKFSSLPRVFDYLNEFKQQVLKQYPEALTIGEVGGNVRPEDSLQYVHPQYGSLNLVFNFDTCWENGAYGSEAKADHEIKTNVLNLKQNFMKWYDLVSPYAALPIYWLNHDHPRVVSQYGSIRYRKESAKMLATTLLFMYGTPFIYNGEEIGMSNVDYQKLTQFKDVSALQFAKQASERLDEQTILRFLRRTSRVNARTPFQWNDEPFAGFSTKEPHLKVNGNYQEVNLAQQLNDPQSIFHYYKKAIALRKQPEILQAVLTGPLSLMDPLNPDVFAYRHDGDTKLCVISNFRNYEVSFRLDVVIKSVLLHNYKGIEKKGLNLFLRPFETYLIMFE
jgi:glycosidase